MARLNAYNGARLAPWWKRVVAYSVDYSILGTLTSLCGIPLLLIALAIGVMEALSQGTNTDLVLGPVLLFSYVGFFAIFLGFVIWNFCILRGRTGQTLGARVVYLRVVDQKTGAPIGANRSLLRQICHIFDVMLFGLGFLCPLFTEKRQTFADMIMGTIVVIDPRYLPPGATSFRGPIPPRGPHRPQFSRRPADPTSAGPMPVQQPTPAGTWETQPQTTPNTWAPPVQQPESQPGLWNPTSQSPRSYGTQANPNRPSFLNPPPPPQ